MVTINNVKMTKKEAKILDGFKVLDSKNIMVKNPYSGVEVELTPEGVAIYDILMGCQITGVNSKEKEELFYAAKDVFARNWPKEYMELID